MIDTAEMLRYLREVGGEEWFKRMGSDHLGPRGDIPAAEGLIEFMGRLCYKSWEPGLNANVTKIREDRGDYLANLLRSGHGSVLAHCWFNFVIRGGSRVFTAEMNRHAVGTAISEQSLRYVRLDDIEFWEPTVLTEETLFEGRKLVNAFEEFYRAACEREFTDDMEFAQKKLVTSALRRWAPLGLATEEGWSGNIRSIRHVIEMRTALHAEEEIRIIAGQIAEIMQKKCPLLFGDYAVTDGEWTTDFRKV
jgi:thymidylate synthase (FAD)